MAKKESDYEIIKVKKGIFNIIWGKLKQDEKEDFMTGMILIGLLLMFLGGVIGLMFGAAMGEHTGASDQAKKSCGHLCEYHGYDDGLIKEDSCICLHPAYSGGSGLYEVKHFK